MGSIGERIKQLRKALNLTQAEFGQRLGTVANMVSMWEKGMRIPNERQMILISSVYNIRREWLEDGTGEMQEQPAENDELAQYLAGMMYDEAPSVLKSFLTILARTTPEEREVLARIMSETISHYTESEKNEKGES